MYKTILPFVTGELKLIAPQVSQNVEWEEIETTIDALVKELETNLNFRWPDSEIYHFNRTDVGVRHRVSEPTYNYLLTLQQTEQTVGKKLQMTDSSSNNYELQPNSWEVLKLAEVKINTNLLFKPFILDEISKFLKNDFVLTDFFLESNNLYQTQGSQQWEIELPLNFLQSADTAQMYLQNQTLIWEEWINRKGDNPFTGAYSLKTQPQLILTEGQNAITTKIATYLAQNTSDRQLDLQEIAKQWRCGFTLIYNDGEIKQVSPEK